MMNKYTLILAVILFLLSHNGSAQNDTIYQELEWSEYFYFWTNQGTDNEITFNYTINNTINDVDIVSIELMNLSKKDSNYLVANNVENSILNYEFNTAISQNKTILKLTLNPLLLDEENNVKKVKGIKFTYKANPLVQKKNKSQTASKQSLLNTGEWFKISVDTTGIFKITYDELINLGIDKPENVSLYGYGGKQLPYMNNEFNYTDLIENTFFMEKGSDGIFNSGDYVLFYGEGPVTWSYNDEYELFQHHIHEYSNKTYYFLTDSKVPGESWDVVNNLNLETNATSSSYDSYQYHEINTRNVVSSGRVWWGKTFRQNDDISYTFNFNNLVDNAKIRAITTVAGRRAPSSSLSYFKIKNEGNLVANIPIYGSYDDYLWGHKYTLPFEFDANSKTVTLDYQYIGGDASTEGVLDFLCLNTTENLVFDGTNQLLFRDKQVAIPGNVTKFNIENNTDNALIWNVTNPLGAYQLDTEHSTGILSTIEKTDSIIEFIVFDPNYCFKPTLSGEDLGLIENQNLHGIVVPEFLIISHPNFMAQAEELADIHITHDQMDVYITTPDKIYNEFSSGMTDISAIRNFVRMLYKQNSTDEPYFKYLLLIGDGSYDNKTISPNNSNFIPTYQSIESLQETKSFVTDDFFGLLDYDEGGKDGALDIGIGRYPVSDSSEARAINEKIRTYLSDNSNDYWRNQICFIGDDDDGNLHMKQPDDIAEILAKDYPQYNVNKIYLDAYQRQSTPMGYRYPDVTTAISEQIKRGALIMDYVGHGNPRLLAHEHVLTVPDVKSWKNINKLGIFVTASCEVGRYDDYEETSMGEWFVLNPDGASVATLTTTRVVFSGKNDELNRNFFKYVLNPEYRLGDVIRLAKTSTSGTINKRNFSLLGDPALSLAIPKNEAHIEYINDYYVINESEFKSTNNIQLESMFVAVDTLNALSKANVTGKIVNTTGNLITEFNGILQVSIYDKPDSIVCYGHTSAEDVRPFSFDLQNSVLHQGQAQITNGQFDFDFIIPKDINYKYGQGKISLYAKGDSMNAMGYSSSFIIGGVTDEFDTDNEGPSITLFMNDTLFVNEGLTDENPELIAQLFDDSGINTTGIGVGHNLTAILDNNLSETIILNSFYQGYIDQYNSGEIKYPFYDLTEGNHTLLVKVWDIHNNSSEKEISFYVKYSNTLEVSKLQNYPNPLNNQTSFTFEHNQSVGFSEISIKIFNLMGVQVAQINDNQDKQGYRIAPIVWDGTGFGGSKLPNGLYSYRIELKSADGLLSTQSSKLMIFK